MKVRGLTRRDLLRWTAFGGAGIAALGASSLVGACGDNIEGRAPGDGHAAAVLEPDSDSFVIAVWSLLATAVVVEVSRAADGDVVFRALAPLAAHTAVIEVSDLTADTEYIATLLSDDGVRMDHRVRTAPRADATRTVRIAVSADIDPYPEFQTDLIAQLLAVKPELYVSLGDFPYTDNGPPAMDLATYRERHALVRTDPRVRTLLEGVGVRAIYDDHEFRNDWDAMYAITEPTRYAAAMQAWDEFFPLRGAPAVKYRSWRWGAHLECFLLDTRRHRSPNAMPDGPDKTMLGATQLAWIVDSLRASTATFKVVFTSVPLDFGNGFDHWSGFRTERDVLLAALAGVPGVLFVSADQHWFAAHRHANGAREFQVGPLARGLGMPAGNPIGVMFRAARYNVGLIDIDGESLTFSGLGAGGEVFYKETLSAADLTPASMLQR